MTSTPRERAAGAVTEAIGRDQRSLLAEFGKDHSGTAVARLK